MTVSPMALGRTFRGRPVSGAEILAIKTGQLKVPHGPAARARWLAVVANEPSVRNALGAPGTKNTGWKLEAPQPMSMRGAVRHTQSGRMSSPPAAFSSRSARFSCLCYKI